MRKELQNLRSDLSYHVRLARELQKQVTVLTRGAISISYGPLIDLSGEVLYLLDTGTGRERLRRACLQVLRKYFGDRTSLGILALEVNRNLGGILDSLRRDFPRFGPFQLNLYSLMVIDVSNSLIREIFNLDSSQQAADAKSHLIKTLRRLHSQRRVLYLSLLEKKDCANGKKLLSLHDLSNFSNGKPEKNKD